MKEIYQSNKVYLFIDGSGTDLFVSATYNGAIDTAIRRGYINYDTSAYACEESDSDDSYGITLADRDGDEWEAIVRRMDLNRFNEVFEDVYQIEELEYYDV